MNRLMIAFCSLLLYTQTLAQPAVLLGPDLEPVSVELQEYTSDFIKVIDAKGVASQLRPDQVLRLTMTRSEPAMPAADLAKLTLRDGQVLVGKLVASNDEEAVRLKLDANRVAQVPLDEVLSLVLRVDANVPAVEDDDALLLATGEVLLGFVETFGADVIGFVVGDADDAIEIPLERINAVAIANKPRPVEVRPGTVRVTTADGSVLMLQDARLLPRGSIEESGGVMVGESTLPILSSRRADEGVSTEASTRLTLPMDEVVSIEPASTQYQLMPLHQAEWDMIDGGTVFGVAMPPRMTDTGEIRLHAPVMLGFDLPADASRLVFTVVMDLDETIPESRRAMAGCELVVYDGDKPIARHTLTPDGPAKRLNVALDGGDLRIALEPGVNGPVLDRVLITRAEVLLSNR